MYQGVGYEEQVRQKGEAVEALLAEKKIKSGNYLGIQGSPSIYRYRNKMEYTFGNLVKDGEMTLGMHKRGQYMSVLTVDCCQLVDEDFNVILAAVLDFCKERSYTYYNRTAAS